MRSIIILLFLTVTISGCAGTDLYPDLSNIDKATGKGLSQKESETAIKDLQKDRDTHTNKALKEIKSTQ